MLIAAITGSLFSGSLPLRDVGRLQALRCQAAPRRVYDMVVPMELLDDPATVQ